MFIYHPSINFSLIDYGIEIPMLNQRVDQIHQWVGANIDKSLLDSKLWLGQRFDPIRKSRLLYAHNENFIESSFKSPKSELFKTFELYNEAGELNRYRPENAKADLDSLHQIILEHIGGSFEAAQYALQNGFAFYLGGGLHHAMTFGGRGFCHYNDIAINALTLKNEFNCKNIWIIDIDAHKGDGTAEILNGQEGIHTFSIHQKTNWPLDSERYDKEGKLNPWFIPSDIDIEIARDENHLYLSKLEQGLEELSQKYPHPDFIMVVSGSDPYELDVLPSADEIQLNLEDMLLRDKLVYNFIKKQESPLLYLISGGYGEHAYKVYIQFLEYLKKERGWR